MAANHPNFLGLEGKLSDLETARYAVLPAPFEATVSYKTGTAAGPIAVLDASTQVELFDEELLGEYVAVGVATLPIVHPAPTVEGELERIRAAAEPIVAAGKFLLALGGEHSITPPLVALAAERHGEVSVLQIDAHADLRDAYEGTPHSHACVMRRVLEITPRICQVGIRSFSKEEYEACPQQAANFITPGIIAEDPNWIDRALALLGETVYVTVDIDGLDPSVAPGTGTPEPNGLTWPQATALLRRVCTERRVVSADIVEVRPLGANHVTEFAAARLAYKIIAYTQLSREA